MGLGGDSPPNKELCGVSEGSGPAGEKRGERVCALMIKNKALTQRGTDLNTTQSVPGGAHQTRPTRGLRWGGRIGQRKAHGPEGDGKRGAKKALMGKKKENREEKNSLLGRGGGDSTLKEGTALPDESLPCRTARREVVEERKGQVPR